MADKEKGEIGPDENEVEDRRLTTLGQRIKGLVMSKLGMGVGEAKASISPAPKTIAPLIWKKGSALPRLADINASKATLSQMKKTAEKKFSYQEQSAKQLRDRKDQTKTLGRE